jgi:DNA polymerase III subunit epsilon
VSTRSHILLGASTFTALDFETADRGRDSVCAIGIVRVENQKIVRREHRLVRPPRSTFEFSWIHGILWEDVADKPHFAEVWRSCEDLFDGAECIVAHNAVFDRTVLYANCSLWALRQPEMPFQCTMVLARQLWSLRPTKLPDVCNYLGLSLEHHDALSDAEACAKIAIAAQLENRGKELSHFVDNLTRSII